MTREQIEAILERVRSWPQPKQEDAAEILLSLEAEGHALYRLSDEERGDLTQALEEVARGEIASTDEVNAVIRTARE